MKDTNLIFAGHTAALGYCRKALEGEGISIAPRADERATHLILPVPSFAEDGAIRGGGQLEPLLEKLPRDITVIGGRLQHPALEGYRKVDLLEDENYAAANANITAHCAVKLAMNKLPGILWQMPVLVIGWGRIGKCLAQLLKHMGAEVTVAARSPKDRAMLEALGYRSADTGNMDLRSYRLVFNTVPQMIAPQTSGDGLKIDLASQLGLGGLDVVWARGLPGKEAPESAGRLMANCILYLLKEERK